MYEARFFAGAFAAGAGLTGGSVRSSGKVSEKNVVTTPLETVRDFYAAVAAGDIETMVALMAPDIEWISGVDFHVQDRGPEEAMKRAFAPPMEEWESFSPAPSEFHADGSTVLSLGRFACVHRATHKRADVAYAHVAGHKERQD